MQLKLENLPYQQEAIDSVINLFEGQEKNSFDNATLADIRANYLTLLPDEVKANILDVLKKNGLLEEEAKLSNPNDICIEMETGTGKTLVYIKTIYKLFKTYGFSKFIILVPSVAIKEGVKKTLEIFEKQLDEIYGFTPKSFEYDSKQLPHVRHFIEEQHPQIMIMTLQSFNSDDRILNLSQREDLLHNIPYIEAIAKTNPIIIMDEPQEGMDTENSIKRIDALNPMIKLRYSATHKVVKNRIFRLSPYESYKKGLVKKIKVLTVAEKNDEASMKIELEKVELSKKGNPTAILKAWHKTKNGFSFKKTKKLSQNSVLEEVTGNVIYKDYTIEDIAKPIRDRGYVKFKNGARLYEGEVAKDYVAIFGEQLYWLIDTHFRKKKKLADRGIKMLSLIFIDKVDNYIKDDGVIKKAFVQQYKKVHEVHFGEVPDIEHIKSVQGYYFAQTGKGDFTDSESSMRNNKKLFDLILKDKEELLSAENPVEFIFSHSALGVGWDNPNVFNIATLNQSYSEIKKRQEIGRGLRICVNQKGQRVYDDENTIEGEEINLLTVIPNETYETFVGQYQEEIAEVYGSSAAGAATRHDHKGDEKSAKKIQRNEALFEDKSFREFWHRLSQKTEFVVYFDETRLIEASIKSLNAIEIPEHLMQISLVSLEAGDEKFDIEFEGTESKKVVSHFSPLDLVEEISESTALGYRAVFEIISKLTNHDQIIKNPPRFLQEAVQKIKIIEMDEMLRAVDYRKSGEQFDLSLFKKEIVKHTDKLQATPQRGIYDYIVWDSEIEKIFAKEADSDAEVVCFLKLPDFYKIPTPIGRLYTPDFGVVMRRKKIRETSDKEYYFVIETKGTNDIEDTKALKMDEINKIKCAIKHFEALGIEAKINYEAPIKEFETFKKAADRKMV